MPTMRQNLEDLVNDTALLNQIAGEITRLAILEGGGALEEAISKTANPYGFDDLED